MAEAGYPAVSITDPTATTLRLDSQGVNTLDSSTTTVRLNSQATATHPNPAAPPTGSGMILLGPVGGLRG